MHTNEKIAALRKAMQAQGLAAYVVNTADAHQSEYVAAHFKERAWLTGFTGSAGTALVTKDQALVWADGRYFIQAEQQIDGSEFQLMKMATPGYPSVQAWLYDHLSPGDLVGMNDATISQKSFEDLAEALAKKSIMVQPLPSLLDEIWQDRPALPQAPIFAHELEYTGQSAQAKVAQIREKMAADGADASFVVGLDDVAWLYNYRGGDVPNNPVSLAYALITEDEAYLFIDQQKLDKAMQEHFQQEGVTVKDYASVAESLSQLKARKIALDKGRISYKLYKALPSDLEVLDQTSYVYLSKCCLNPTELACQKAAYLRDSAAITRFLFWLKREVKQQDLDELQAADQLHLWRSQGDKFLDESFSSISAYGPNAAMMHYAPSPDHKSKLQAKSFYLIDSGGQYLDGTTDITRTIALGPLTEEEKTDFTLTLKSHINLASAKFLEGTPGYYLDCLARQPLWQHYMDYKCGTGHGVGYVLGVHEGPQRFSKVYNPLPLQEGMHITIEPGVYKEGKHGIRLENDYVVSYDREFMGDKFYQLEVMSFVPLDREAINSDLLNAEEIAWLDNYHQQCYDLLLPQMTTDEERADLKAACAPLK
ncbi:MAG: aminopeptidase P family protein [Eubacteriales bacterium]|nr:aminopeptidase P family protein [Eubacteriales bacterium]